MKNYQTGYLSIKNRYHVLKNKAALLFGFENLKPIAESFCSPAKDSFCT